MFDYSESDREKVWKTIREQESEDRQMNLRCGLVIYDTLRIMLEGIGEISSLLQRINDHMEGSGDRVV